jgi:hypothetical protein
MIDRRTNPFNELYVTETVSSSAFVRIFSPFILKNAAALFLPGNVVVKGMQGCGKSMLLSLLKPEVRIAYAEAQEDFPLAGKYAKFFGAGINLTRSGAIDFGQRHIGGSGDEMEILPIYFGDFLNYWIVYDVLNTLSILSEKADGKIAKQLKIAYTADKLAVFTQAIKVNRCWFGYLDEVNSFEELRDRISFRINSYLNFLNFNSDDLSDDIRRSKTTVGEPIAQVAEHLRLAGIVPDDVHLIVRIDQYEELIRLEGKRKEYGSLFREVVNKALSLRNPHVSYRIGTRGYAWGENPRVFGTEGYLERDRNFKLLDLDEILRRRENRKSWIFPDFAQDVFRKRLLFANYDDVPTADTANDTLNRVFGQGLSPEERAVRYCGRASARAIKMEKDWPREWCDYLLALAEKEPLSARLGEAWARQKANRDIVHHIPEGIPPWISHKYWRKERIEAALMQIAGRCAQRMIWAGSEDVVELSGGNILVFVSLCQHIWSVWLRTVRADRGSVRALPTIDDATQAVGIQEASTHWYAKLAEESGGTSRQRFVSIIGADLERKLYNDDALSYPGRNGFSLSLGDLEHDSDLKDFLNECVDYGALVDSAHTTKESNRRPRRKWYLNAVLSPHFRLPHVRTKEPAYMTLREVTAWLYAAQLRQSILKQPEPVDEVECPISCAVG